MLINQANLAALFRGFRSIYMESLQGSKPQWTELATKVPSTKGEEVYAWLGEVPGMKKIVGEIPRRNLSAHTYTVRNDKFGSIVTVPREDIERDSYGTFNPLMAAMGIASAMYPDEILASLLVAGFTTKDYTGKNFFDTNKDGSAGAVKGAVKFDNKGTAALSADSFAAALINIMSRLNSEGRPMNLGRDLALIVPPQLVPTAKAIVQFDNIARAVQNVGKTENVAAVMDSNPNKGMARIISFGYLAASPTYWFLADLGQAIKPWLFQDEVPPQFTAQIAPDSESVFDRDEYAYKNYARGNVGFALPQLAFGSTGGA